MSEQNEITKEELQKLNAMCDSRHEFHHFEIRNDQLKQLVTLALQCQGWQEIAKQHCSNEQFYRELLDQTAAHLGPEVFIADDGSKMDEPIRLKIPELVKRLVDEMESTSKSINELHTFLVDTFPEEAKRLGIKRLFPKPTDDVATGSAAKVEQHT